MTKLTQLAIVTRKIIRWGIFTIIFLIIGKYSLDLGIKVYRRFYPVPPPAPTVTFGKLPKVAFPQKERPKFAGLKVETATGEFPKFSNQAKVYFMPRNASNLLSLESARARVGELGYGGEERVSETVYRFKNNFADSTIEINIVTGVFSVSSNLSSDSSIVGLRAPAAEIATSQVRSFLSSASLLPGDLTESFPEFLKVEDKSLVRAISLSEANFTKVNLFKKDFDKLPSLTGSPDESNVWFIVSGSRERGKQIIAGQYQYFPVDGEKFATYPIKTAEMAFNELLGGGGFVASRGTNPEDATITIRKIYLGYFDPKVSTDFYQPIIVLEGDDGFLGYVPAVTSEFQGE